MVARASERGLGRQPPLVTLYAALYVLGGGAIGYAYHRVVGCRGSAGGSLPATETSPVTEPSNTRSRARRIGRRAAGVMGLLGAFTILVTVVPFRLNQAQVVMVVVLEATLAALAARNLYVGTSRLVDPSWLVERVSYSTNSTSIDGELHTVSTPSHLVGSRWSRPFCILMVVLWTVLWAAPASAFLAWAYSEGARTFDSAERDAAAPLEGRRQSP